MTEKAQSEKQEGIQERGPQAGGHHCQLEDPERPRGVRATPWPFLSAHTCSWASQQPLLTVFSQKNPGS